MPCPRQSSPLHGAPPPTSGPCPSHTAPPDSSVGGNTIHLMTSETGHSYSSLSASITIQSNSFNHFSCSVAAVLLIYFLATLHNLQDFSQPGLNSGHSSESPDSTPLRHQGTPHFKSVIFQILDLNLVPPPLFRSSPDTTRSATLYNDLRNSFLTPNIASQIYEPSKV